MLEPWADSPEFLAGVKHLYFDRGETDAGVMASRVHKGRLLITLRGVTTVEQGDALRGLKVIDADDENTVYGELTEVSPTGANDVYRIVDKSGKEYLFPAVKHMIQRISVEEGVIELLPIPGIFDEEGEEA